MWYSEKAVGMKQTIRHLALLLIPLLVISSCTDDKMVMQVTASSQSKSLYLSANYITTGYESSKTSVSVKASAGVGWEFVDIPDWVSVSPTRGTGYSDVTVYFTENTSTSKRSKILSLITTDSDWYANIRLELVQDGKPKDSDNPENPSTYEGVDLGLSVLWATFNVGATSPESYGGYYAWGETNTKNQYDWSTYKWCAGSENTLTKYSLFEQYGNNGFTDDKYILDESDDVAHVLWGQKWRIPSRAEFNELLSLCSWEDETLNGVQGYRITSMVNGYEGRSIFLPCAGMFEETEVTDAGSDGYYWTNSISTGTNTYSLFLYGQARTTGYMYPRYAGLSIRPVAKSDTWPGITSISLNQESASLYVGGSISLDLSLWSGSTDYSFMFDGEWSSDDNNIARVNPNGVVTGVSPGSTYIRASCNGVSVSCYVAVLEYEPVADYVDLGLSVNWATCNIGAMEPQEYGNYYAWGEISNKDVYSWSTYSYSNGSGSTLTRYCNDSSLGKDGYQDELSVLLAEDDVAFLSLSGYANYRMPTKDEFEELIDNCTWTLTQVNGVDGYLVTSRVSGYEGNSIFLPLAGYRSGSGLVTGILHYWTSSMYSNNPSGAWCMTEYSGSITVKGYSRYVGGTIRPVIQSSTWTPNTVQYSSEYVDMGLSVKWASCNLGAITPDGYGNFYTWGETQPKKEYWWKTYTWAAGTNKTLTKYNTLSDFGYVDNLLVLEQADDAAYVALGYGWRIPTRDDYEELLTNCTWTWTQMNGHNGYLVTAPNNNSIFLPASGSYGATYMGEKGLGGYYWSNALYTESTDCAWTLSFKEGEYGKEYVTGRAVCASIRPVYEEDVISNPDGLHNSHEYVDLGLSVKWATCNVDASSPEVYGGYYAWAETETKTEYSYSTYIYSYGTSYSYTKYCDDSSYGYDGFTDNKTVIDPEDDVAHVKWGGDWRIPSLQELEELTNTDNCQWIWKTINGVDGYLIKSRISGYTDKSIFLPAAGDFLETNSNDGVNGYYRSNSIINPNQTKSLYFTSGDTYTTSVIGPRVYGEQVRPVFP